MIDYLKRAFILQWSFASVFIATILFILRDNIETFSDSELIFCIALLFIILISSTLIFNKFQKQFEGMEQFIIVLGSKVMPEEFEKMGKED